MTLAPSKIFAGFRALGFVSNHVPLVTRYHKRHKDNYAITSVGKSLHVYNVSRLGIVAVSDAHPEEISVIAADSRYIFTACGNDVFAVERNKKITKTYKGHSTDVTLLLPFGNHLVSVDSAGFVIIWDIVTQEQYLQIKFETVSFEVTTVVHPHTYMNKVLFGSQQGALQLWNLKSNRLIYSFEGWGAAVTAIQQSTAIDVMAIGLADGQILLHNLAKDKTVVKFKQDYGPVNSIGFRTDGHPMMVSGSAAGHIALWDLENRKLHSYMKDMHQASITGLVCLPSEPLMITSAADNSLKVWIFDLPDGGARLLRLREGHSAPPTYIRFYDSDGQNILSSGQDSTVRSFSTVHDKHNKSLGRASYHKKVSRKMGLKLDKYKMPPVIKFAAEPSRESDWDNILACHRSLSMISTWSYQRQTMGKFKILHRSSEGNDETGVTASAVEISACGNFGLVGYSTGQVDMYNMQSGQYRSSFGNPKAHDGTVRGVACDGLNQKVVTASANGCIRFWKFKSKDLLGEVKTNMIISQILLQRDSSLLAVAFDDFTISIMDTDTRKQVRLFHGHSAALTDMTFSSDGRWLISTSMDCSIRTWNLPTGRLIDAFLVELAPTSITMSPCSNFMATTHVGDVGVYLWSNRTLYSFVSLSPLPADYMPKLAELPRTSVTDTGTEGENLEDEDDREDVYKSVEQISDELVTLSLLPTSRWLNLLNLDVIKMRNKPKEPPKVPKSAPFFLPTVAGLDPKFAVIPEGNQELQTSHIQRPVFGALSDLAMALTKAHQSNQYSDVLSKLKAMGPSTIDKEIRTLNADEGGSDDILVYFMKFIESVLQSNKDFELAHSYLALFIKVHGDEIASKPTLADTLSDLSSTQLHSWERVRNLMEKSLGMVAYLRSATL